MHHLGAVWLEPELLAWLLKLIFNIFNFDFIKIDVEGYELPVLVGGIKTILKNKPVICMEQNGSETKWRGQKKMKPLIFYYQLV